MFEEATFETWCKYMEKIILPSVISTLRMLFFTMFFAFVFGFLLSIVLYINHEKGLKPNKMIYKTLDTVINVIRSFPIIIMIVAISPITRLLVGTSVGERAAIFPLTLAATPFIAKLFENAFLQVDKQLILMGKSFGASNTFMMFRIIVKESIPTLVSSMTLATITYLSATTMAGAVGAGGIGAIALSYGYQSFNNQVLYTAVFILCILVQIIQSVGNRIYNRIVSG